MKMQKGRLAVVVCSLMFFSLSVLLLACYKDAPLKYNGTFIEKCKDVVCFNGGVCRDGLCVCPDGFSGAECKTTWNALYTGTYTAFDECDKLTPYATTIAPLTNNAAAIVIRNITVTCPGQELTANITKVSTNLEIPLQKGCGNNYISGTGSQTENGKFVNLWLTTRDTVEHTSTTCSIVLSKQ